MLTDAEALYAAILTHPDEDTPRLEYADEIQEHGEYDRAEFIRVQCELARHPGMNCGTLYCSERSPEGLCDDCRRFKFLSRRSGELESAHRAAWLTVKCGMCGGKGGGVYGLEETEWECEACNATGDAGGLTWPIPLGRNSGPGTLSTTPEVAFARGFPAVVTVPRLADAVGECPQCHGAREVPVYTGHGDHRIDDCWTCNATGHVPSAWLASVCRHHPVEQVVCLDREPFHSESVGDASWFRSDANNTAAASHLPGAVFDGLEGGQRFSDTRHIYPTPFAAITALARRVVRWARDAGSPVGG